MSWVSASTSRTRQRMTREGCITRSSASMRRITASSQTWVRQARMMPFALLRRERMLRVLELEDIARDQLALAGAAVAGLARERERDARAQQRFEHRVSGAHRDRLVVAFESDLHGAQGATTMVSNRLGSKQNDLGSRRAQSRHAAGAARLPAAARAAGGVPGLRRERVRLVAGSDRDAAADRRQSRGTPGPPRPCGWPGPLYDGWRGRYARGAR